MKAMRLILIAGLAACSHLVPAETIVLDSCEDLNFTVKEITTGESLTPALSTEKTEGKSSVQITYQYQPGKAWTREPLWERVFPAPLDLSRLDTVNYDLLTPAACASLMLRIHLVDEAKTEICFADYGSFNASGKQWKKRSFRLADLIKSQWVTRGQALNLSRITKIGFHLMNNQAISEPGQHVFFMDNVAANVGNTVQFEAMLENFEAYGDSNALTRSWTPRYPAISLTLANSGAYEGSKCQEFQTTIEGRWKSHWATLLFSKPRNFSDAKYFKMAVFGDERLAACNPAVQLALVDVDGNRAYAIAQTWLGRAQWSMILFPLNSDGIEGFKGDSPSMRELSGASCWTEDFYDDKPWGARTNLSKISSIQLHIQAQNDAAFPIKDVKVRFDNVAVGFKDEKAKQASLASGGAAGAGSSSAMNTASSQPPSAAGAAGAAASAQSRPQTLAALPTPAPTVWYASASGMFENAGRQGKPMLLYFRREGFKPCDDFERSCVLSPAFQQRSANLVCIYEDVGAGRNLANQYNVFRVPDVLLINSRGEIARRFTFEISPGALYSAMDALR